MSAFEASDTNVVDLRTIPLAACAWAGTLIGLLGDGWLWGSALAVTVGLGILGARTRRRLLLGMAFVAMIAGANSLGQRIGRDGSVIASAASQGAFVTLEATVSSDVRTISAAGPWDQSYRAPAKTDRIEWRGTSYRTSSSIQVSSAKAEFSQIQAGTTVRFSGKLKPGEHKDPFVATLSVREFEVLAPPGLIDAGANRVRQGLRDSMRWTWGDQRGLVPSLVVGDTSGLPPDLEDSFRKTGLTHLTAVSGTNLTLLLAFLLPLARTLGVRGYWNYLVAVLGTASFVFICRSEPSVTRAAVMGLVAVTATGRTVDRRRGLRHLGTAVLLLTLAKPWIAVSWGFALSVLACAGILWWGSRWQSQLRAWLPGPLAEALAIPMAAQLATQPVVTYLSGEVSLVGLGANALAGPFVGAVTVLGIVAALVSLVCPFGAICLGWAAGWAVQPIITVAQRCAGLPSATIDWPTTVLGISGLSLWCLGVGAALGVLVDHRWIATVLAVILIIAPLIHAKPPGWPGPWLIVTCDVGQGDARVLRSGPQRAVLVDAGPEDGDVVGCLRSLGVRQLDLIILTHAHADHAGGLSAVASAFGEIPIVTNGAALAAIRTGPVRAIHAGDRLTVGDIQWLTLTAGEAAPSRGSAERESPDENNGGLTGLAAVGGLTLLVTGDLEEEGQQEVMRGVPELTADVIAVPHHGSPRQSKDFFGVTNASIATISVGENNGYGHPSEKTLRLLSERRMKVYRTDVCGAISVGLSNTGGLVVTTAR